MAGRYEHSEFDNTKELSDRLVTFMSRLPDQLPEDRCIPMEFHLDADSAPRLIFSIYHCLEKHLEHEPLRTADGSVRSCFTKWPLQFADIPDPLHFDFRERKVGRDKAFYAITGVVEMHASDSRLSVSLKLLGPHQHLMYRKESSGQSTDELMPNAQYRTFFTQTKELWDQHRTHAVLEGNGLHVLQADSAAAAHHQAPYQAQASSTGASSIRPTPVGHDDCDDEEEPPRCPKTKILRSPHAASSSSSTGTIPSTGTLRKPT
ncbi:hypothetical protein B0A55_10992 [Friedmanniomyces simplex]|uniref:Uncharacterized protein n=1 Tax=Friedmanniomyces simplex TaxID=329884 RepID=A0A4U0WFG9_9PEZI|nr:hypothetical protein B0A55_10992 [Friedmanniomyces simplex]